MMSCCCGVGEEFAEMERLFHRVNTKIKEIRLEIVKFEINPIGRFHSLVETNLNFARDRLLDKAKTDQQVRLGKLDVQNSADFISSKLNLEKCLTKLIADKSIENNNFMKFKYLSPEIEPIKTYQKCSPKLPMNVGGSSSSSNKQVPHKITRLHLSERLLMNLIESTKNSKSIAIKIEDTELSQEIYSSRLRLKYDESYQVLSYGLFIVILVYNDFHSNLNLLYYDRCLNELLVVKQRTLHVRVNLHSMNRNEIVCMQVSRHAADKYLAFDYEFEQTAKFGQKASPDEPFYVRDASLIGISLSRIYLSFYDIRTQKHCVKILNRLSGRVERLIDLDCYHKANFNSIRLDSSFRIMVRCGRCDDRVRYYDCNGDYLFDIQHPFCFGKFKCFEQISDNCICFSQSKDVNGLVSFL